MKVLLIGGGGREHALAWKLAQSPLLTQLFIAPGNPGMADLATLVPIEGTDIDGLVAFSKENGIEFVVVGPEVPLCLGLVDALAAVGIKAFGPHQEAAQLEGSKAYAKEFMIRHNIPTAQYERFDNMEKALAALPKFGLPVVIKADGLAAGKGVVIAETSEDAIAAIKDMMHHSVFGDAGDVIVLEEFLRGIEASQLCFVDGQTILPLESSQDYKRAFDGDLGPNTGGMGTYSPSRLYDKGLQDTINQEVLLPFAKGLIADGIAYQGLIFIGLMIENGQPKVIEFNVRFGDPETQSLMVRLESDLLEVMVKTVDAQLAHCTLKWSEKAAVCVVMASGGYPDTYLKGQVISGLDAANGHQDVQVFHAGTALKDGQIVNSGGRVLNVVATGTDLNDARGKVYGAISEISFEGGFYRTDIAGFSS